MNEIVSSFFASTRSPTQAQLDWLTKRHGVPNVALGRDLGMPGFTIGSATVAFDRHRFDFVEPGPAATSAIIIVARDLAGEPVDLVAWTPKTEAIATLYGRSAILGAHNVLAPRFDGPLAVHRSVLGWLKENRLGVVLLDHRRAWRVLDGVKIVAEDIDHGLELRRILTPPSPTIVVPAVEERIAA